MDHINTLGYVVVTDHLNANTGEDVSDAIQKLINENPHRTIYFPDGEYIIAKPICTSANPENAVSIMLSDFATIKAADGWDSDEAMIRLGAAEPFNTIMKNGSNYRVCGGIIDGNGVAQGIAVESGRETRIEGTSIKHTSLGLHIKKGANGNSSDADILNVNIVGNCKAGSIGMLIEGSDNSFTNMRIAGVQIGVKIQNSSAQIMKNLHPLYIFSGELADLEVYKDSIGFLDCMNSVNWYNNCYSDQFATGFYMQGNSLNTYSDCYCYWYTDKGGKQHGYESTGKFNSVIRNSYVRCKDTATDKAFLVVGEAGGKGIIYPPISRVDNMTDKTHEDYLMPDWRN